MHRIFVYGTLKTNEINAWHMTDDSHGKAIFVGIGWTTKKYPLVLVDFKEIRNVPAMIFKEDLGHHINGEIWDIDDTFLEWLDDFEDYPNIYGREILQITRENNAGEETCIVYMQYNVDLSEPSKFLENYNSAECGEIYKV